MNRPSGQKREREKARQQRAKAKAAKREDRRKITDDEPRERTSEAEEAAIMVELAELQRRFEAEEITFDDFDDARQDLARRLDLG